MAIGARRFVLALLGCTAFGCALGFDKIGDWTPPKTTVAKELVEVGKFLLEHGMADPRGGKFAIVKIGSRSTANSYTYEALGWVKEVGGQKVLVDMAGLLQPVESVVRELSVSEAAKRAIDIWESSAGLRVSNNQVSSEHSAEQSSEDRLFREIGTNEATVMLLIDGDVAEAESLYESRVQISSRSNGAKPVPVVEVDLGPRVLQQFVARQLGNVVRNFESGYDDVALAECKVLADNADAYRKYAQVADTSGSDLHTVNLERYLGQVPALQADLLRRVKEGPKNLDLTVLDKLPQKERIEKLIDLLDEVRPPRISDMMTVSFLQDPIVRSLIREDSAAGDALLDCLEKDRRLTRTTTHSRTYLPFNNLVPVRRAAIEAFVAIAKLNGSQLHWDTPEDIQKLRAEWNEVKGLTPNERWMSVLRNPKAKPAQWVQASTWFAQPSVESVEDFFDRPMRDLRLPPPPARFEELSKSDKAELSSLLLDRAQQIAVDLNADTSSKQELYGQKLRLSVDGYRIDPKKAAPVLRTLTSSVLKEKDLGKWDRYPLQSYLAKAFGCLILSKDQSAERKYIGWLKQTQPSFSMDPEMFLPLTFMPPNQGDRGVRELLFDPKSNLYVDPVRPWSKRVLVDRMAQSPLLYFPSFRNLFANLLAVKSLVGTISVNESSQSVDVQGYLGRWSMGSHIDDPNDLADARKVACRACDYYATQIAIKGAPEFKVYWSSKRKDEAIKKLIVYLNVHFKDIADNAQMFRMWQL